MDECAGLRGELSFVRAAAFCGESTSIRALCRAVHDAAPADIPVLITGEVGVGKTSVAALLHDLSRRSNERFIAVRCPSMPPTLHEATIFGYVEGAFTGGPVHITARCEAADGGTLFVSGVDELSPDLQVKLLRLIEHGEYIPIGGISPRCSSVRILAGTTRELSEMVQRRGFNESLYRCLQATTIRVPPLRERAEDVVTLARLFVSRLQGPLNRPEIGVSLDDARALMLHHWPGNLRELRCAIELAMITSKDGRTLNLRLS